MVSIGELARRTGTTPRMLRHWEATGLLPPAATDPLTGRRSYDPAQEGRVQSIVALRANGFGLDAIRDLLDSGTDHDRLRAVLDARRSTVAAAIARDNAALSRIDRRIDDLDRARDAVETTLHLGPLPALAGFGVRTTVMHESEIPAAARLLRERLAVARAAAVTFVYDGTTDPRVITISAVADAPGVGTDTVPVLVAATDTGATVLLRERPVDLGDVWTTLDAALLPRGRRATGPYRHVVRPDGAIELATPTVSNEGPRG